MERVGTRELFRNAPIHKLLSVATAVALVAATAMLGSAKPADALFGDIEIDPIESNLAEREWVSATASSGGASAELALDQDPSTAWVADGLHPGEWLTLDLGGTYDNVRKAEVVFPDKGAVYQYVIEASSDGNEWETVADRSDNDAPGRGAVDLFTRADTRYLRVTITGSSPGATIGVSEIAAFNYLRDDIVLGADLSYVDNFQDREYWVHPLEEDRGAGPALLDVVDDRGFDFIRLRIFNEPRNENSGNLNSIPHQGPERSLTSAQWIKDRDLELGIDFHYADSWADPGKQPKPRGWAELEFDDLAEAMYDYTYDYIQQLIDQGTTPDKVAVGNEVNNGFLWGSEAIGMTEGPVNAAANPAYFRNQPEIYQSQPGGGLLWPFYPGYSDDPDEHQLYDEAWDRFATLMASGISAVRDASADNDEDIKVEIHSLFGSGIGSNVGSEVGEQEVSGREKAMEFWGQLLTRVNEKGQDPDVLALSYYPEWHGTMEALQSNMHALASTYPGYEIDITETSYPASGGGGSPMPNATFPRTVQGQADAIQRVFQANNDVINNQGGGVLTWEPASWQTMFRSVPGMSNTWEPHSSIDIYNQSHAEHVVEGRVYTTAQPGGDANLPSTVQVLTTADGSVQSVPVEWETLPSGATDSPGEEVSVVGTAGEFGEVTAIVDVVYDFGGFERPITELPDTNSVNPGRAIPVKFTIPGGYGLGILGAESPAVLDVDCDTGSPLGPLQEPAMNVELEYDAGDDSYRFVWKTDRSFNGCKQLVIDLDDGTRYAATFDFRR